jgi:RimJ/RimL family protein N-acetyltransferase
MHAREWVRKTESWVTQDSKRVDFAIVIAHKVCGSVSFINIDGHKAQVSYWLTPALWGEGIAPEALSHLLAFGFDELGLVRIYAYVYTENKKSARVLEKAGFQFEGVHRKEWRKVIDGEYKYFDSNYYAIVKEGM